MAASMKIFILFTCCILPPVNRRSNNARHMLLDRKTHTLSLSFLKKVLGLNWIFLVFSCLTEIVHRIVCRNNNLYKHSRNGAEYTHFGAAYWFFCPARRKHKFLKCAASHAFCQSPSDTVIRFQQRSCLPHEDWKQATQMLRSLPIDFSYSTIISETIKQPTTCCSRSWKYPQKRKSIFCSWAGRRQPEMKWRKAY